MGRVVTAGKIGVHNAVIISRAKFWPNDDVRRSILQLCCNDRMKGVRGVQTVTYTI